MVKVKKVKDAEIRRDLAARQVCDLLLELRLVLSVELRERLRDYVDATVRCELDRLAALEEDAEPEVPPSRRWVGLSGEEV